MAARHRRRLVVGDARCRGVARADGPRQPEADPTRRRRPAQAALLAGADAAQSALRDRREGSGRSGPLLRGARALRPRRQSRPRARRRDPEPRQRRHRRRRALDGVEAQEGRALARRASIHGRRCRLQLHLRDRPDDGGDHPRAVRRDCGGDPDRRRNPSLRVPEADATLAPRRHGSARSEAPVRGLRRRALARCARQPAPGRHRPVPVRRLQAGRPAAPRSTASTTRRTGRTSTASR